MVEQWFELYADDVYSFLAYMVRDRELAKDLTQETFIKAMKGVNSFRADSSPKTWLLTIARNVALNHNRKIQSEVLVDEFSFDLLSSPMESLEDTVQRRDTYRRLLDVLQNMKPSYRDVIVCREVMGMTSEETAQVLGWTVNKVAVTLHRALRKAKQITVGVTKHLEKQGETVSQMVEKSGATAGVNGGAFKDINNQGTGALPLGITIQNGRVVTASVVPQPVVGFTNTGKLIAGYYSVTQLKKMGVTQAVSSGPVLVSHGSGQVHGDVSGYEPRTAIGQRADGTVIFIVTDGRYRDGAHNLGSSLKDLQDLMLKYGAVTAANLYGGSATTMVYQGHVVNHPSTLNGEREVATSFLISAKH